MQYPRELVEELNALSKEVTGSKSRWRKLIDNGEQLLVTEEVKFLNIVDGKEVTETKQVPALHQGPNGGELQRFESKRYTIDNVKDYLLQLKTKQEEFSAAIAKMQEDAKAKEAAKAAVEKIQGSAT